MSDVPEILTNEVGAGRLKLPLWLWGVAAVVGVYIGRKVHSSFGAGAAADDAEPLDDEGNPLPAGGFGAVGAGGSLPVFDGTAGGAFDPNASAALTDNDQWRKAAVTYLASTGADSLAAARAIDRYLIGDTLTDAQMIMVESALRRLGPTPEPVPPPLGDIPPPEEPPPVNPPPVNPPPVNPPPTQPQPPKAIQQTSPLHRTGTALAKGETLRDFCNLQNGRGTWWITNVGRVLLGGSAPYLGSPKGAGDKHTDWSRIDPLYPLTGYKCTRPGGVTMIFRGDQ